MVRNPSENVNRETTSFTTPPTSSIKPPGSDSSINNKKTSLRLAVWTVSSKGRLQFQRPTPSLFQVQGDKFHYQITIRPGQSVLAGVV